MTDAVHGPGEAPPDARPRAAASGPSDRLVDAPPHTAASEPPERLAATPPPTGASGPSERLVDAPPHTAASEPPERLTPAPPRRARGVEVTGFVLSTVAQVALIVLALGFTFSNSTDTGVPLLLVWCGAATLYSAAVIVTLGRVARRPQGGPVQPSRLELSRAAGAVAVVGTVLTSSVGLGAAVTLAGDRSDPVWGAAILGGGIWAMLLSWGLLHWGFAQLYYLQYYRSPEPIMHFPGTPHPRIVEFVYFSFTLGTSFAASDVSILTSRLRWRVVWHSVLSFLFNGVIIVFAFTSIFAVA